MANWLERAKGEIRKSTDQSTDNTDERNLTAVSAVSRLDKSEIKTDTQRKRPPVTEDLAANAPARSLTDEVARILAVWRRLGIKDLDGLRVRQGLEPVGEHLMNLRRWAESFPEARGSDG